MRQRKIFETVEQSQWIKLFGYYSYRTNEFKRSGELKPMEILVKLNQIQILNKDKTRFKLFVLLYRLYKIAMNFLTHKTEYRIDINLEKTGLDPRTDLAA